MEALTEEKRRGLPQAVRILLVLLAITAAVSLLYAIQYYLGGPIRLSVVSEIKSLDLSPDGTLVASGNSEGEVDIWTITADIPTTVGKDFKVADEEPWPMRTLEVGAGEPVWTAAFTPDGGTLVAVTAGGIIQSWSVPDYAVLQEYDLRTGPLVDAALSGDRQYVAALTEDGTIHVFDRAAQQEVRTIAPGDATREVVALNADGTLVAAGEGIRALVWSTETGEQVQALQAYCDDPTFTTEDACDDARKEWLGHDEQVTALAFSPDGQLLATGSADTTVIFWDLETGEVESSSVGHWATVTTMAFSADSAMMLTGGADYKVRDLRVAGGRSTAIFEGHLSTVHGVAYGPSDASIMSAADDGTVRVWETANQYLVHLEWSSLGLQPVWGKLLAVWMLVSGLVTLLILWGLLRTRLWAHLLALALFLLGPIVVIGLPLFEVLTYPLGFGTKLQIAWPLLALLVWYIALLFVLTREPVSVYYEAPQEASLSEKIMVSQRTLRTRFGVYSAAVWIGLLVILYSILRRFNLDIAFMGSWFEFILAGSFWTFIVSVASIILAMILALLGALGRLSKNPLSNAGSGFYISLIRGTPLLVQIYIWYLGLPRLGIVLNPVVAGILALGVNYGAYMTEIFRAGIQAVSLGQREAAQALGMSSGQTFRRIILPQAFRIVIPPIGNEFIAMMKDSSLVSVMTVQELTWRANKIGRQYFRGIETFIIAAAFYWVLTVLFQLLQGRLEEYMARGERR
ncbi:MAG: ABC transporter permease subunit [Anaerolineae bacterium]